MWRPSPRCLHTESQPVAITHFPLKLVSRRMLAPTVAHLSFVRDDGQPLDFIPGQFLQVHFHYGDGTATKRSYSLATIHDHALGPGEAVEIAVSYVSGGAATALFEGLGEGVEVVGVEQLGPRARAEQQHHLEVRRRHLLRDQRQHRPVRRDAGAGADQKVAFVAVALS